MVTLHNSLRSRPLEETLMKARVIAARLGVTRVTDTTRLDRIGIPVYSSIRPSAADGSLCVNAGKGTTSLEAEVGAYMEAIEYGMAEPNASRIPIVMRQAKYVLEGPEWPESILDLCPQIGAEVPLDQDISCVQVEDLVSGELLLVPAELIFLPWGEEQCNVGYFGSSSNGLASGNTLLEASLHGLFEAVERDTESYHLVKDRSVTVDVLSLPEESRGMTERITDAGLEVEVRYLENEFGVPHFRAVICDPTNDSVYFRNSGSGCHLHAVIALNRAITECVQSRMAFIHGGRDDLQRYEQLIPDEYLRTNRRKTSSAIDVGAHAKTISFDSIPDFSEDCTTIQLCMDKLLCMLAERGFLRVLRAVFTEPGEEIQVVKIVVPRLEDYSVDSQRVGPRIVKYVSGS